MHPNRQPQNAVLVNLSANTLPSAARQPPLLFLQHEQHFGQRNELQVAGSAHLSA